MNKEALKSFRQFSGGTNEYHRFAPFPLVITDGVKHLINNADAYWLMNIIGSYLPSLRKDEELSTNIQHWYLRQGPAVTKREILTSGKYKNPRVLHYTKAEGKAVAHVVCERFDGSPAVIQELDMTDFPFDVVPEAHIVVGFGADDINAPRVAALPIED